ncbi:hypothetical protein Leryth_021843 [Lithospermum erythrorhizon]|nr:hypothetical protein Leryth_021843 [Lithospermum erythrorhizon]
MTQILNNSNKPTCNNDKQSSGLIKFLYSYGGKIVPRRSDAKLRYIGGHTRVLSVERSITFAELMIKFGESCGESMILRCKLPSDELDVLVSIKFDEDLRNVIEEYDNFTISINQETKIRAILTPSNSLKKMASPPSSPMSCFDFPVVVPPRYKAPVGFPAVVNWWYGAPVWRNCELRRYQRQL